MPLRIAMPILMMGLPFALAPILLFNTGLAGGVVWLAIVVHAIGADWLLIAGQPRAVRGWHRRAVQLAIGAPTAVFSGVTLWFIAREGDVAWMVSPLAAIPALLVWPAVIWALARDSEEASASRGA
jgi:hypothetical protein